MSCKRWSTDQLLEPVLQIEFTQPVSTILKNRFIRLWAQNLNVLLLCNPVTTQWCNTRGQMSHNVSKRTKLLWQDCTVLSALRFCAQSLLSNDNLRQFINLVRIEKGNHSARKGNSLSVDAMYNVHTCIQNSHIQILWSRYSGHAKILESFTLAPLRKSWAESEPNLSWTFSVNKVQLGFSVQAWKFWSELHTQKKKGTKIVPLGALFACP